MMGCAVPREREMTSVEVIVPVYNVADFLPRCLASLLGQTHSKIRIWLVDDGSTDGCSSLCDEYANRDPRVAVIHKVNGGQASARNAALDKIFEIPESLRGGYVAFVDSDDWVESDYVEFLVNLAQETGAGAVQCGHWITYSNTCESEKKRISQLSILSQKEAMESILRNGLWDITCWNKLFDVEVFNNLRFPEGIYYEDTAIAPLFTEKLSFVAVCMVPKYHYVQRYNSTANGVAWTDRKLDFIGVGDGAADYVLELYPDLEPAALEKRIFVRLSTLAQMVNTGHHDKEQISEMRCFIVQNAWELLTDPAASRRDKLGTILIIPGFWLFRAAWKLYYVIRRRR